VPRRGSRHAICVSISRTVLRGRSASARVLDGSRGTAGRCQSHGSPAGRNSGCASCETWLKWVR